MKLRYVLIMLVAAAGFGASIALADDGHSNGGGGKGDCHHSVVFGSVAPQSLTITVTKANDRSGFTAGQAVTLSVGGQGQQVRVAAEGCVGTDGTVTVHELELHVRNDGAGNKGHEHGGTTTDQTSTTSTTTADGGTTTTHQ
jgi:hypothetical protein